MSTPIRPTVGAVPNQTPGVEPLKPSVALNAETQTPNFGGAFSSLAMTPSALASVAAQMTQTAGNTLGTILGTELGKNPRGNILPPLTTADKSFVESYEAQAQAALSNQVNTLVNKSAQELNKGYKLTPEGMEAFNNNVVTGAAKILEAAPYSVRANLENSIRSSLTATNNQNTMRYQTQQKTEAQEQVKVDNQNAVKGAFNNSVTGDINLSRQSLRDLKATLAKQRNAGIITPGEEQATYEAAKINMAAGAASKGALEAQQNNQLPAYLRSLDSVLPNNLTPLERMTATKSVLGYMDSVLSIQKQDNQLILTQLNRAMVEGSLTGTMLTDAQQKLPEADFNTFMTKYWSNKNTKSTKEQQISDLASHFTELEPMSQATDEQKKGAFNLLTDAAQQKNPNLDRFSAQTAVAMGAAGPVKAYTNLLDAMLTQGGPDQLYQANRAISQFDMHPENLSGLSAEGRALSTLFQDLHDAGVPADAAWQQARDQVLNKTKEQREENELGWNEYKRDNLSTLSQRQSKAKEMLGAAHWYGDLDVPDLPQVTNRVMKIWESNYKLTNNNKAAANSLTSNQLASTYGETYVNGRKQIVFMPLEKMTKGVVGFIQNDIVKTLGAQLAPQEQAFKEGKADWYYRFPEGEVNINELLSKREALDSWLRTPEKKSNIKGSVLDKTDEFVDLDKSISEFKNGRQLKLEKVWRGHEYEKPSLTPSGLISSGNMELNNLKKLKNKDGSTSSVSTITAEINGKTYLLPTVINGKRLSNHEALSDFKKTGQHLGVFKSQKDADLYDEALHEKMGWIGEKNQWPKYQKEGLVQKLNLQVTASRNLQMSNNPQNPISGGYDYSLTNDEGWPMPFDTVSDGHVSHMLYKPNIQEIQQNSTALNNSTAGLTSPRQMAEEFIQKNYAPPSKIPRPPEFK